MHKNVNNIFKVKINNKEYTFWSLDEKQFLSIACFKKENDNLIPFLLHVTSQKNISKLINKIKFLNESSYDKLISELEVINKIKLQDFKEERVLSEKKFISNSSLMNLIPTLLEEYKQLKDSELEIIKKETPILDFTSDLTSSKSEKKQKTIPSIPPIPFSSPREYFVNLSEHYVAEQFSQISNLNSPEFIKKELTFLQSDSSLFKKYTNFEVLTNHSVYEDKYVIFNYKDNRDLTEHFSYNFRNTALYNNIINYFDKILKSSESSDVKVTESEFFNQLKEQDFLTSDVKDILVEYLDWNSKRDSMSNHIASGTKHKIIRIIQDALIYEYGKIASKHQVLRLFRNMVIDKKTGKVIFLFDERFLNINEFINLSPENHSLMFDYDDYIGYEKIDGSVFSIIKYKKDILLITKGTVISLSTFKDTKGKSNNNAVYQGFQEILNLHKLDADSFIELLDLDNFKYSFELVSSKNHIEINYEEKDYGLYPIIVRHSNLEEVGRIKNGLYGKLLIDLERKSSIFKIPREFRGKNKDELFKGVNLDSIEGVVLYNIKYGENGFPRRLKLKPTQYFIQKLFSEYTNVNSLRKQASFIFQDKVEDKILLSSNDLKSTLDSQLAGFERQYAKKNDFHLKKTIDNIKSFLALETEGKELKDVYEDFIVKVLSKQIKKNLLFKYKDDQEVRFSVLSALEDSKFITEENKHALEEGDASGDLFNNVLSQLNEGEPYDNLLLDGYIKALASIRNYLKTLKEKKIDKELEISISGNKLRPLIISPEPIKEYLGVAREFVKNGGEDKPEILIAELKRLYPENFI